MFFVISKTLSFILKPLGIILILGFLLILTKNRTKQKRLSYTILVLLYIFSNPLVIGFLSKHFEPDSLQIQNLGQFETGVILTGGITNDSEYGSNFVGLGSQADRVWQALELYRLGKIKRIVISGGEWRKGYKDKPLIENDYTKLFLRKNGVPDSVIIQEKKSRNTFENALETRKMIGNKTKILVITTAFHCKRAELSFKKQGFKLVMFPVNSEQSKVGSVGINSFLPSSLAFRQTDLLFNELIGLFFYKLAGFI